MVLMDDKEIHFCPLCKGVKEEDISKILKIAKRATFSEGEQIYFGDDPYRGIFVTLRGEVRLYSQNEKGKEFLVKRLASNTVFGESGKFNGTYLESASAQSSLDCIFLPGKEFEEIVTNSPQLSKVFMTLLSSWLTDFYKRFQTLSYTNVTDRVKHFLIKESEVTGNHLLDIKLRRHEIASNIGVRPETLSRVLGKLEKENLIKIESNSTIVLCGLRE